MTWSPRETCRSLTTFLDGLFNAWTNGLRSLKSCSMANSILPLMSRSSLILRLPHYATNADEANDRWRRQIKYALLDLKDEGKEGDEAVEQLRRRYSRYARRWKQTDSDDLLEMFLTAITTGYDPHSTYMSAGTLHDFQITMSLNLDGIGAQLREKDGNTIVTRVIPGGAAAKHGKLTTDDAIVSVGQGDEGEMVDIVEMPLTDVVDLIRGKAGTTVRLGVKPGGVGNVEILQDRSRSNRTGRIGRTRRSHRAHLARRGHTEDRLYQLAKLLSGHGIGQARQTRFP